MAKENSLKLFIAYLEQNRNHSFTKEQWNKIVLQNPLEQEDKESLEKLIKQHLDRSEQLRKMDHIEEAIEELDRAIVLNPMDWKNRYQLTLMLRSYYENFSHNPLDRKKCQRQLNRLKETPCPRGDVSDLEKSLEQLRKILEPQERGRSGALFLLLPLIIALILGIITQRDYLLDLAKQWQASKNPPPAVEVIPEREIYGNREPELFNFPQDSMDFQLDESKILRMNGHDAYSLQARIIPKGTPINQGSLQLRFLQEDSTLLEEKLILLPGANQGTIDPGETLLIDHFDFLDVDPKSIYHITLIMGELDRQESLRGSMEDPLNLTWAIERPGNVNLHLQWKELNYLEAYDRFYYLGELLLENQGSQPLSHLELELQGFGKSFNPLYRSMFNPVNRHSLELLPGEKRPFRIVLDINQQDLQPQNQWNMEITEIELDSTQ